MTTDETNGAHANGGIQEEDIVIVSQPSIHPGFYVYELTSVLGWRISGRIVRWRCS